MTFYIAAVYDLFRKEVDKSTDYFAVEKTKNKQFDVVYVKPDRKLPWAREKFTVVINNGVKVMTVNVGYTSILVCYAVMC